MLQADFLLTANREDIDQSSIWNDALRRSIVPAFLDAIHHFNLGALRYLWPQFVSTTRVVSYFDDARIQILEELSDALVLESFSGDMRKPTSLTAVPPAFIDDNGIPFSLETRSSSSYLSPKYPEWHMDTLVQIGVHYQLPIEFLHDLRQLDESIMSSKSLSWHCQLATALLTLMADL